MAWMGCNAPILAHKRCKKRHCDKAHATGHVLSRPFLTVLLNDFAGSWQAGELSSAWQTLRQADTKDVLCHTLRCYFVQNCDLSQTSKQLHIHVNTLRYRLQKIEAITALKSMN